MTDALITPDLILAALGLAVAAAGGIALVWLGRTEPEPIGATARAPRKGK